MLKEETCLAQFGLQMTAVVTAQEKASRVLRVLSPQEQFHRAAGQTE